MRMKTLYITMAVAIALVGCKKDVSDQQPNGDTEFTRQAKGWFESQTGKKNVSKLPESGLSFAGDEPQWSKTAYLSASHRGVVPVTVGNLTASGSRAQKFLVLTTDESGKIVNGTYTYILENTHDAIPALLTNDIPATFTGAIIEYELDGTLISSRNFTNGKTNSMQDRISQQPMREHKDGEQTANSVPSCESGQTICIDWYWQTYQNGVLIYEEYLYTTCHCEGAGSGGNNTGIPGPCGLTCEQVDRVLENITITTLHEVNGFGGTEYTAANGVLKKPWTGYWKFLKLELFPGFVPEYKAFFTGVLYRNSPAVTKWRFESFNYTNYAQSGGSIPPCMSVDIAVSVATSIAGDQLTANAILDCVAQAKVSCLNDYKVGRHTISSLPQAFAPPPVLLGND